jgi:hypothetical protein
LDLDPELRAFGPFQGLRNVRILNRQTKSWCFDLTALESATGIPAAFWPQEDHRA